MDNIFLIKRNNKGRFIKGSHKGCHLTKEEKEKIGKANKGNTNYFLTGFQKGHKVPQEWREKYRKAIKGRFCGSKNYFYGKHFYGEKHGNWKGGISKDTRIYKHRRRLREKNGGELTLKTVQLVYEDNIKKYGTLTCYLCETPIQFGKDCLEHKTPLSRNGTNEYNNLAVACRSCNNKKGNKTEREFRKWSYLHTIKES